MPRSLTYSPPIHARPSLTNVLSGCTLYDVVTLRIGEHLAGRNKQDVEQDLVSVILRLAEDGQAAYSLSRPVEGRAARARESERICEMIMKTTEVE